MILKKVGFGAEAIRKILEMKKQSDWEVLLIVDLRYEVRSWFDGFIYYVILCSIIIEFSPIKDLTNNNTSNMEDSHYQETPYRYTIIAIYLLASLVNQIPANTFSAMTSKVEQ